MVYYSLIFIFITHYNLAKKIINNKKKHVVLVLVFLGISILFSIVAVSF